MKKSLIALAFGTLALGMSEFVMMGILPDIARSLGVSIPEAGHLISAYALGVCFGAPLTVLVARTRPLKQILLALTALIAVGNLCASLAPNYWMLMAMRFVSGLPHGAFFGVGSIVAERVADAGKRTEAVSIMIVGMTVANLFGVPLGTYISNVLSWRTTFAIVAVWGVVALTLVRMWVPRMEPLPDTGLKGQFRFLRNLAPWLVLASVMLGNGGIFCWYSYVSPLMIHTSGFTEENLTLVIMLAGFGMFAGNILGGEQHGHMESVGYDMYLKLLNEAVAMMKGEAPENPVEECTVDMQVQAHIPESYIDSTALRLDVYRRIADIKTYEDSSDVVDELIDRFGEPPESVYGLIDIALLRNRATQLGITEVKQQANALLLYKDKFDMERVKRLIQGMPNKVMLSAGSRPYISVALGGKAPLTVLEDVLKVLCGDEDAKAPKPATK